MDESDSTVPMWVVGVGVGIASFVIYKAFLSTKKFVLNHEYVAEEDDELHADYPKGQHWVTNPWDAVKIRLSKKGGAARPPTRVFELFQAAVKLAPQSVWFLKEYKDASGKYEWRKWTRQQVFDLTMDVARAMIACELEMWHSVAIIGFNAPEWHLADLGAVHAGGLVAGIYGTNNAGQCRYVAEHSRANLAVVENEKQLKKFLQIRDELKLLKRIIIWDPSLPSDAALIQEANANNARVQVVHWREFIKLGQDPDTKNALDNEMQKRIAQIKPGHCCTLIYTSGTTGPPKAVMMSHDNVTWQVAMFWESAVHFDAGPHSSITYLPMSHAAAQLLDLYIPLQRMATDCDDWKLYFARPDALKGSLKLTMVEAKPTIFFGVPRVWEKFHEAIKKQVAKKPPNAATAALINMLKSSALTASRNCQVGGSRDVPNMYWLCEKLVFPKLKKALGLERCKGFYTGAAPVQRQTLDFFASVGINIFEAYGMSECCGVHTMGLEHHNRIGCVGPRLNGVRTMLQHQPKRDKKGEGEICMRGRHVMMGYMFNEPKTRATIDEDGWLHTGDVGSIDQYDILSITGRIKELIVTAGGENVAPVPIEDYIKRECPAVSNVVTIGDKKKYLVCMLTLAVHQDKETMAFSNNLAKVARDVDPDCTTVQDARNSPKWKAYIEGAMKKYNADTDYCVSRAQRLQYFRILDKDFSVETGELTATLKLKRPVVAKKYADVIASMY